MAKGPGGEGEVGPTTDGSVGGGAPPRSATAAPWREESPSASRTRCPVRHPHPNNPSNAPVSARSPPSSSTPSAHRSPRRGRTHSRAGRPKEQLARLSASTLKATAPVLHKRAPPAQPPDSSPERCRISASPRPSARVRRHPCAACPHSPRPSRQRTGAPSSCTTGAPTARASECMTAQRCRRSRSSGGGPHRALPCEGPRTTQGTG